MTTRVPANHAGLGHAGLGCTSAGAPALPYDLAQPLRPDMAQATAPAVQATCGSPTGRRLLVVRSRGHQSAQQASSGRALSMPLPRLPTSSPRVLPWGFGTFTSSSHLLGTCWMFVATMRHLHDHRNTVKRRTGSCHPLETWRHEDGGSAAAPPKHDTGPPGARPPTRGDSSYWVARNQLPPRISMRTGHG